MQVQRQYKNLSKSEQGIFDKYLSSKLKQIETLLQKLEDDTATLDVRVEKFEKHDAYEVECILKIPMKTMKSKEASHMITKAVDLAKDRMVIQLKKFQEHLRTEQLAARQHASIRKPDIHEIEDISKEERAFMKA